MPNNLWKSLLVLAGLIFLSQSIVGTAEACSCGEMSPEGAFNDANVVFAARVDSYSPALRQMTRYDWRPPFIHSVQVYGIDTVFSVSKVWKGEVAGNINANSKVNMCGGGFDVGEEYLVYGYLENGVVHTRPCTRTRALSNAGDDLKILGPGSPPKIVTRRKNSSLAVGVFITVIILAIGMVWLWAYVTRPKSMKKDVQ